MVAQIIECVNPCVWGSCSLSVCSPADFNEDCTVDGADYTVWADHYNQPGSWEQGDASGDGFVDEADYTLWADSYNVFAGYPCMHV